MSERGDLVDAVLALAGERGVANLTVTDVIDRAGTDRRTFDREFEGLEEAFAEGYGQIASTLSDELLAAGRAGEDWRAGFRLALVAFLGWAGANPGHARVLMTEYRVAGPRAWRAHEEMFRRLARAIDTARTAESDRHPPPEVAGHLLGAIEFTVGEQVRSGDARSVLELETSLAYYAVSIYYGHEVAGEELDDE